MGRASIVIVAISIILLCSAISVVNANSKKLKFEKETRPKEEKKEETKAQDKDPFEGIVPNCDLLERGCVPISNFTFLDAIPRVPSEELVQILNKKLAEKKYSSDIEFRLKVNGSIGLFANKKIPGKTKFLSVPLADALTSDALDLSLFSELPEHMKLLKYFKNPTYEVRNKSIENFVSPVFLQFATQFLLHLYNPSHSLLKEELSLFARDLSDMVVLELEKEEIELLDENLKTKIINERYILREGYKVFLYLMRDFWSEAQIKYFFNNNIVPYQDFVYSYYLFKTKAWHINLKVVPSFSMFVPIFSIPDKQKEVRYTVNTDFNVGEGPNEGPAFIASLINEVEEGSEILFDLADLGSNLEAILFRGYIPKKNLRECVEVTILDSQTAEAWNAKKTMCINSQTLNFFYALGNLINMKPKALSDCGKEFDQSKGFDYKAVYEKCEHPEWKVNNLWIALRNNLNQLKDSIGQIVKNIDSKYGSALSKSMSLLREHYLIKLRVIDETLAESEKVEEFNKSLNGGKVPAGAKIMKDEL